MRYLALTVCLIAAFMLGTVGEGFATERMRSDGERVITEHGHHGGWGRRGGRGWRHGGYGPSYGGGYYCR